MLIIFAFLLQSMRVAMADTAPCIAAGDNGFCVNPSMSEDDHIALLQLRSVMTLGSEGTGTADEAATGPWGYESPKIIKEAADTEHDNDFLSNASQIKVWGDMSQDEGTDQADETSLLAAAGGSETHLSGAQPIWKVGTSPSAANVRIGDSFIEFGNWRLGDVDGTHAVMAHRGTCAAQIFRSDGTIHGNANCASWQVSFGNAIFAKGNSVRNIQVGDRFIDFGQWRIGDIDGTHAAIVYKPRGCAVMIWRNDATLHGGSHCASWQLSWGRKLNARQTGSGSGILFGDRFMQLGAWRVGLADADVHAVMSHSNQWAAQIYRSDGTLHGGGGKGAHYLYDWGRRIWQRGTIASRVAGRWVPIGRVHAHRELCITRGTSDTLKTSQLTEFWGAVSFGISHTASAGVEVKAVSAGTETTVSAEVSAGWRQEYSKDFTTTKSETVKECVKNPGTLKMTYEWQWDFYTSYGGQDVKTYTKTYALTESRNHPPKCLPGYNKKESYYDECTERKYEMPQR